MSVRRSASRRDSWLSWRPGLFALVLALLLAAVQVVGTHAVAQHQPDLKTIDGVAVVLLTLGPLALVGRHRHPVVVLWLVSGATLLYMLLGYPYGPVLLSELVALYSAIMAGHRLAAWLAGGSFYLGHFSLSLLLRIKPPPTWTGW